MVKVLGFLGFLFKEFIALGYGSVSMFIRSLSVIFVV